MISITDLSEFFEPIELKNYGFYDEGNNPRWGDLIFAYKDWGIFPNLEGAKMAIIGVGEDRSSGSNAGCGLAPCEVRRFLYELVPHSEKVDMVDLGNLRIGNTVEDTYHALGEVVALLLSNMIIPIIIGGSADIVYGNYLGYERIGQIINVASVDSRIDFGYDLDSVDSRSYITKLVSKEPNYVFNLTNIGYQTYFVDAEVVDLMKELYFDSYRLGVVRDNLDNTEPLVRNADLVAVDMGAVRQSDAPGNAYASPHGLYGEELCKIVRYSGMSDKCTSIGFYEVNPGLDRAGQTAHLVAHAIWYFVDGYLWRKQDYPYKDKDSYRKFHVPINDSYKIVFYRSRKSSRWWMEVPVGEDKLEKYMNHYLIPCSYEDYKTALEGEIPDRWLLAFNKIKL